MDRIPKFSKQLSVSSVVNPSSMLHATPVSPSPVVPPAAASPIVSSPVARPVSAAKLPSSTNVSKLLIPSLKIPILLKKDEELDKSLDASNLEVASPSTTTSKKFFIHTGLPENEPVVVLSSEFVPLYLGGERSKQGDAINLKDAARALNAKTAMTLLKQSPDVKVAIDFNKSTLRAFMDSENAFMTQLMAVLARTYAAFDLHAYNLPTYGNFRTSLLTAGYSTTNLNAFSQTKLWQQSLVELKRCLLAHSPLLVASTPTRTGISTDADPYKLSDIDAPPPGVQRLWLNPYISVPGGSQLANASAIEKNIAELLNFDKSQYVNLSNANPLERISVTKKLAGLSSAALVIGNDVLRSYESSGRDISIIANSLFKESTYSSFVLKKDNVRTLATKFGYVVSSNGDNFQVWDSVVGRFSRSVLDVVPTPTGNGNSMVSISQALIGAPPTTYHVMTFENQFMDNVDVTPGTYYYIDTSLNTANGTSFDTSRLDDISGRVRTLSDTTRMLFDMVGYDISTSSDSSGEKYTKRPMPPSLTLSGMTDKLSIITKTYKKCLRGTTKEIDGLDSDMLRTGFGLSAAESIGVRLAAAICKCAVQPSSAYIKLADKLKILLFMWVMNCVLQQAEGTDNAQTITVLKARIAALLGSARVNVSGDDIAAALLEGRTFPNSIGSSPGLSATPDGSVAETPPSPNGDDPTEAEKNEEIDYEKRQALTVYTLSVTNRIFQIDSNRGLWKVVIDAMKDVYSNPDIFVNDFTGYSGTPRTAYMYGIFDLMLRIIAAQTPENMLGAYSVSYEYASDLIVSAPTNSITIEESGFLVDAPTKEHLNEYYDARFVMKGTDVSRAVPKLSDAGSFLASEEASVLDRLRIYRNYVLSLGGALGDLKTFLQKNFERHLTTMQSLYQQDGELSQDQKNALLDMSMSEEQVVMSRYIMSEFYDRMNESSDVESKLKATPFFVDFPDGFIDMANVNEVEVTSFRMLSPYFKSEQFLREKGCNKRILSIGVPPGMVQSLRSAVSFSQSPARRARENVVRLKVYKLDRLHPDIVYQPQVYLFEMNRFPTRVIGNWNFDAFSKDDNNILNIPSKLYVGAGGFMTCRDFTAAFPADVYGPEETGFLTQDERYNISVNHAVSFLAEEYLRWFTDCHFDETRYNNFAQLGPTLDNVQRQYQAYVDTVKLQNAALSQQPAASTPVIAQVTDPTSGVTYNVPTQTSDAANRTSSATTSPKTYVIPMDDSVKAFFANETFLLDPIVYQRRVSYPKKFDRVFNVIVDPDDFFVDESTSYSSTLKAMKAAGLLIGGEQSPSQKDQPYRHRDTTPDDITFDEYFVTIEPYDHDQDNEG